MGRPPRGGETPDLPTGPKVLDVLGQAGIAPVAERVYRRWEEGRPLARTPDPPLYVRLQVKLTMDPAQWPIGFVEVHERMLPPEVYADLRELVPQALLRDLHRPVKDFFVTPEEIEGTNVRGAIRDAEQAVRRGLVRAPLPTITSQTVAMKEARERRRALFAERWLPMKTDDAIREGITL